MRLRAGSDHLTDPGGHKTLIQQTHAGQAHFGGTGPAGKFCWQCMHWRHIGFKKDGNPKMAACEKGTGAKFSHDALACKHFKENPSPPKSGPKFGG